MSITINSGFANTFNDTTGRKAAVQKTQSSPFSDYLASAAAPALEKTSLVTPCISGKAANIDPFAVVRSGALSENNAFVLALKRMFAMDHESTTGIQIPDAIALDAVPEPKEDVQSKPAIMEMLPNTGQPKGSVTDLSQLISSAVEQSVATTANHEVLDTIFGKLS